MKRSSLNRSDPEVIRDWQRRGVEAMQAKRRKLNAERLRKEEREAARSNRLIKVYPEYVTPIVTNSRGKLINVERNHRALDDRPEPPTPQGVRRKINGQTIVERETGEVEAFFRSPNAWHPPMIIVKRKASAWGRVRREVIEAAYGRCQAQASPDCQFAAQHVHHVLPRGRGGKDDGSTPLLAVCFMCHDWIHGHPTISYDKGWLVRTGS